MLILNSIICKMCSSRKYCIRTSTQRVGLCLNHFPPQMYNIKASRSCSQWKWETRIASSNQRVSYLLFTLIYSSGSFQRSPMQIAISVKKDCLEPEINLSSMATWHHIFPLYEVWKILLEDWLCYFTIGDGPGLRDFVIRHGVVGPLLKFVNPNVPVSISLFVALWLWSAKCLHVYSISLNMRGVL